MTFLWRRRRSSKRDTQIRTTTTISSMELTIPSHFKCPISLHLMKDPVSLSTGITYDRDSIEKWIDCSVKPTCPVTNQALTNSEMIPNHALRKMIQDWCVENTSRGVERIPTPRVPITPYEVIHICSRMVGATEGGDEEKCGELVEKIKNLSKESERNKRCIVGNGVGLALAQMLEKFARFSVEKHGDLLREILSALTWSFPIGREGISKLRSSVSLHCMAWFLKGEDLSTRRNAILVLKESVFADQDFVDGVMEIEGIEEALLQLVKLPICPKATQACLVVIHQMILSSQIVTTRFVRMGSIPLILGILVDGNNSICEKALGVLDRICDSEEGKEIARKHALTVPLVVKKILRVSNTATEFSVSILWKLSFGENKIEDGVIIEGVQLGAFQKLLVVLQVGCGEGIKEKVTELLKLMSSYRDKLDCFDSSMGFKYLKRPN